MSLQRPKIAMNTSTCISRKKGQIKERGDRATLAFPKMPTNVYNFIEQLIKCGKTFCHSQPHPQTETQTRTHLQSSSPTLPTVADCRLPTAADDDATMSCIAPANMQHNIKIQQRTSIHVGFYTLCNSTRGQYYYFVNMANAFNRLNDSVKYLLLFTSNCPVD